MVNYCAHLVVIDSGALDVHGREVGQLLAQLGVGDVAGIYAAAAAGNGDGRGPPEDAHLPVAEGEHGVGEVGALDGHGRVAGQEREAAPQANQHLIRLGQDRGNLK